jgi:tight adherence protein C
VLYLVAALFAVSVALFVIAVGSLIPGRPRAIERRLAEVAAGAPVGASAAPQQQRRRRPRRERITALLQGMGERIPRKRDTEETRQFLIRAGYRHPAAPSLYWGARVALGIGMALVVLILLALTGAQPAAMVVGPIWLGAAGWVLPAFAVRRRMLLRQKELLHALPDALDMMVVCMEAGLGLNQALLRVSEEIVHVSRVMSEELALVNLEIRAGAPRETALRNLGERTGVQDIRSLVAMLIQTDRFGTSVAQALRVQADTLRQKRRQRAEETAAKTTIKLVFPLVLFILPAMFVVILGPSLIQIMRTLSSFR